MSSDKTSNQGHPIVPSQQTTTEHMPEHEIQHTVQIQDGDGDKKRMTVSTIIKFRPPSWMVHPQVQTTVMAERGQEATSESASASSSVQVETRITMPFNAVATPAFSPEVIPSQSPSPLPTPAPESSPFLSPSQSQASQPQEQVAEEQAMGSQELRVITRIQTGPWTRQMTKQYGRGSKYEPFTFCNIPE